MARPKRCRRICTEPDFDAFAPAGIPCAETVTLTLEEYETIRLIDLENCTHQQCAQQMDISRTTTDVEERFAGSGADVYWKPSAATCSIRNQYFTADKEKRACTSMGVCDPFRFDELPDIETKIYHFAGLVYGDFDGALFAEAARHGKVAVDVQCLLRHVEADRTMAFHDWAEKKQYLPVIDYLKTDAAEAEILTGLTDRAEAAKLLHSWGAKEVLITHNTEVLAYDGVTTYTCPIKARNLSGRTGRGDTTFAGYISERQRAGVEEALRYCTALVSLKMETPGPFQGTRQDVLDYIREFY